jgi:hypothetical protein
MAYSSISTLFIYFSIMILHCWKVYLNKCKQGIYQMVSKLIYAVYHNFFPGITMKSPKIISFAIEKVAIFSFSLLPSCVVLHIWACTLYYIYLECETNSKVSTTWFVGFVSHLALLSVTKASITQ